MEREVQDIARYFADNRDFYTYYRMGYTHHDELYFVRGEYNWKICPDVNHFDGIFSTSGDGKLAEMMANEMLLKYIDERLNPSIKLTESVNTFRPVVSSTLKCTASPTDIVELGYALHANGFFNDGKASVKDIMNLLSEVLQLNLRNYSQTFYHIRERKINTTKFMEELKADLTRYIDQLDELK